METVDVTVTGRGEEAASAHVTLDMKESFAWTVLRDISVRRGMTPSPHAKVSTTDCIQIWVSFQFPYSRVSFQNLFLKLPEKH